MRFIDNKGITDPAINLAMEEYVLHHAPVNESYFLFYINSPSIIVGKNQNALEEFNRSYVNEKDIQVVRRLSGGGTVYHDLGNLNFSFITSYDGKNFHNYSKFVQPIVETLNKIGVPAELNSRNDIFVNGRKISGNAQFAQKGRMLSHGTLLLNANLDKIVNSLSVSDANIHSKSIKSVRSKVANINEFLSEPLNMDEFKEIILEAIFEGREHIDEYLLKEEDWQLIHQISQEKYKQWEWNFGRSPKFSIIKSSRFPMGGIEVKLIIEHGLIVQAAIIGDFLEDVAHIENSLIGATYHSQGIQNALKEIDVQLYSGQVSKESFIRLLN
ncbi:lipoate--protein ligase [Albibacterium bauzanense]|uniref:lipoate--protein ligase n=1 Tax=Albibacterium bauzanense TaxID=653929 RepID=A0A4R1M4W7_9SPHI|nr:lipoate--protein ligase [Albibacterium bauzanense]TCK84773.1 lipoate-protein ligase [Albibacterium bauzanense]